MFQYYILLKGAGEMILTGNSLFSFRILESENLQPPQILQPILWIIYQKFLVW